MKLAEALILRADIQKRLAQLSDRLDDNAKVQEGESPSEDPAVLTAECERLTEIYERLIYQINMANASHKVGEENLTRLLARRDAWQKRIEIYRDFLQAASSKMERFRNSEIVVKSTVDVAAFQVRVDKLSRDLRILDSSLQAANWQFDIDFDAEGIW